MHRRKDLVKCLFINTGHSSIYNETFGSRLPATGEITKEGFSGYVSLIGDLVLLGSMVSHAIVFIEFY